MKYFIANWKANFNTDEVKKWMGTFLSFDLSTLTNTEIIICAPFHVLSILKETLPHNIHLGAQTISEYGTGAYTGEISASMINDLVSYAIIGHSERRKYFNESEESLHKKSDLAQQSNIKPIYCVRNEKDVIASSAFMVAYEPIGAIGTGRNQSLDEVITMKQRLQLPETTPFIYGGSINEEDIQEYLKSSEVNGFLIGGASLDPSRFYQIISTHSE
jgi:triosephosphate isomerase